MKTKDTIEQNQKANLPVKSPTSFTSKTGGINKSQKLWTVHQTLLKTWTSNLPGLVDNVNKQSAKFCWQCEQTNFHTSFTSQNKRDQQKLGSVNHQSAIPPNSLGQRSRPNNPSTLCTCQGMVLFQFSWVNTCTDSSVPILPVCAQYTLTKLMMLEIPYLRIIYQDTTDATSTFLYSCESWTFKAEPKRRIQAMEMKCYRKILHISYKDHVTNEEVCAKIQQAIGPHKDLLTIVKRRKLQWYGHVSHPSGLAKTILYGTVKGGRSQGRQRKRLEDNIREWTGLEFGRSQRAVENRGKWRKLVVKSSVVPQQPSRLRDRRWWWWWWW